MNYRSTLQKLEKHFVNIRVKFHYENNGKKESNDVEFTGLIIGQCGGCNIVLAHFPEKFGTPYSYELEYKDDEVFKNAYCKEVEDRVYLLFEEASMDKIIEGTQVDSTFLETFEANLATGDEGEKFLLALEQNGTFIGDKHPSLTLELEIWNTDFKNLLDESKREDPHNNIDTKLKIEFNKNGQFRGFVFFNNQNPPIKKRINPQSIKNIKDFFEVLKKLNELIKDISNGVFLYGKEEELLKSLYYY